MARPAHAGQRSRKAKPLSAVGHAALVYAQEFGFCVVALHSPTGGVCSCGKTDCTSPGKHPRTTNGLHDSTTFAEQVAAWWDETPEANVGIVTGAVSGIVVLDVDGSEGEASLARLGEIQATAEVRTARGRHLYFAHPGYGVRNSAGKLGPKLDVRGDGGYVVAPPFLARRLAANATAAQRANPPRRRLRGDSPNDLLERRVRAYLARVGSRAQGTRNSAAFQVAAWLTHDMAQPGDVALAFLADWNNSNAPPLAERELHAVLNSAIEHGQRGLGVGLEQEAEAWEINLRRALGGRR